MAVFTADVEGLDELMKAVSKLGDDAMPYVKKAADEAGNVVLQKTIAKAPVDTGNLKSKLVLKKMNVKKGKHYIYDRVTTKEGAAYAVPLELGHRMVYFGKRLGEKVAPRPFMRPAADESKDEVVNIVTKHLNDAIDNVGGNK